MEEETKAMTPVKSFRDDVNKQMNDKERLKQRSYESYKVENFSYCNDVNFTFSQCSWRSNAWIMGQS
jgi:hypothetical protein